MPTFTTTVWSAGGTTAGIRIPDDVMNQLGGRRVRVVVTIDDGYTYRTTTTVRSGLTVVGFSKAHRDASGYSVGDQISAQIERDSTRPEVVVPPDLVEALTADSIVAEAWKSLSYSRRKEHARSISEASTDATRRRRLENTLSSLRGTSHLV